MVGHFTVRRNICTFETLKEARNVREAIATAPQPKHPQQTTKCPHCGIAGLTNGFYNTATGIYAHLLYCPFIQNVRDRLERLQPAQTSA